MHVLQIVTYAIVEKGMEHKGKLSFGDASIEAAVGGKRHILGKSNVEQ